MSYYSASTGFFQIKAHFKQVCVQPSCTTNIASVTAWVQPCVIYFVWRYRRTHFYIRISASKKVAKEIFQCMMSMTRHTFDIILICYCIRFICQWDVMQKIWFQHANSLAKPRCIGPTGHNYRLLHDTAQQYPWKWKPRISALIQKKKSLFQRLF